MTYLSLYKSSSTKARRLYDEELDEEELEDMEDVDYGTSNGGSHSSSGEAAARKTPRIIIRNDQEKRKFQRQYGGKITRISAEKRKLMTETNGSTMELGASEMDARHKHGLLDGSGTGAEAEITRGGSTDGSELEPMKYSQRQVRTEAQPGAKRK